MGPRVHRGVWCRPLVFWYELAGGPPRQLVRGPARRLRGDNLRLLRERSAGALHRQREAHLLDSVTTGQVRIAVVGCGWWGTEAHLPALVSHPYAEPAAVVDPDRARR